MKRQNNDENFVSQTNENNQPEITIDLTDPDEARKAFIASEILNKKYK